MPSRSSVWIASSCCVPQNAIALRRAACRQSFRRLSTEKARSCGRSTPTNNPSHSKAGTGQSPEPSKVNTSPSGRMTKMGHTESTSAQTSSKRLTWQHEKVSTMFPNICQLCLRSEHFAAMTVMVDPASLCTAARLRVLFLNPTFIVITGLAPVIHCSAKPENDNK